MDYDVAVQKNKKISLLTVGRSPGYTVEWKKYVCILENQIKKYILSSNKI